MSDFDKVWTLLKEAGVSWSQIAPVANPSWSHEDRHVAWWAAGVLADVSTFQQVMGDWIDTPIPSNDELKKALDGLRGGTKAWGPLWWRQVLRWWRTTNLEVWRTTVESTRQAAWQRQNRTKRLLDAVGLARTALLNARYKVEQWQIDHPAKSELAQPWLMQAAVQEATLMMLEQRTGTRWGQEKNLVNQVNQASALLDMVRQAKSVSQAEQAWAKVSADLPNLEAPAPKPVPPRAED